MATLLKDAELLIIEIEIGLKDLKEKYEGKQSDRVLSNHVWMIDQIEEKAKKHVGPLLNILNKLKETYVGDFRSSTNFDILIKHCDNINKILNDVISLYRMRVNYLDIKLKWQYVLPQLTDNLSHVRNRFNIIKGQITRKKFEYEEEESWF